MPGMRYGFLIPLSKMDMGSSGWRLPHTTPWVLERGVQEASHYCIGTIFTYLHGAWLTLCPFWVRRLNISQRTFPCWDGIDCGCWFEHLKKLDCGYDKHNCCSSVIYFEFWIRNQPFHRLNDSNLSALQRLFRSSDWFDLKSRWEISKSYIILIPKTFLWYDDYFLSNFCFVICHLTGKCPRSFFLSFFLGFRRSNLITGLSRWRTPD